MLPVPAHPEPTSYVSPRDTTGILLSAVILIVLYESLMAHCHLFEALNKTLRYIINSDELFDSKLIW